MTRSRPSSVIVIGAGFAGLAAALRLSQAGAQVTVLDQLERPGGKAALGWPDFSSGPTVVTMPNIFRGLHQRLGLPEPLLTPARPTTTYHYAGKLAGRTFAPEALDVAGSLDSTLAQLSRREARQYTRLLELSQSGCTGRRAHLHLRAAAEQAQAGPLRPDQRRPRRALGQALAAGAERAAC